MRLPRGGLHNDPDGEIQSRGRWIRGRGATAVKLEGTRAGIMWEECSLPTKSGVLESPQMFFYIFFNLAWCVLCILSGLLSGHVCRASLLWYDVRWSGGLAEQESSKSIVPDEHNPRKLENSYQNLCVFQQAINTGNSRAVAWVNTTSALSTSQQGSCRPVVKKCPPRGSVRVRTPPRGRQGRCSAYPRPPKMYSKMSTHKAS